MICYKYGKSHLYSLNFKLLKWLNVIIYIDGKYDLTNDLVKLI